MTAIAAVLYGLALVALDLVVASHYGTAGPAAAFQAAYLVPALLANILSGGAILGALVPLFVARGGRERLPAAQQLMGEATVSIVITLLVVVVLLALGSQWLVALVASGFNGEDRASTQMLLRLISPMLVCHGIASVFAASLLSVGRYAVANLSPALVPIGALLGQVLLGERFGIRALAAGLSVGALLQAITLYGWLRAESIRLAWPRRFDKSAGGFFRSYVLTALAAATISGVFFVNQSVAGSLSARELAAFAYGTKIVTLFLAFCTTVAANTALPHFASIAARGDAREIWTVVRAWSIRSVVWLLPIAVIWAIGAELLVRVVYERGAFSPEDVELVARVQRVFVLQMPFYVAATVCLRMHNSLGRGGFLTKASLIVLLVDVVLALALSQVAGVAGIALAHVLAMFVWLVVMLAPLKPRA